MTTSTPTPGTTFATSTCRGMGSTIRLVVVLPDPHNESGLAARLDRLARARLLDLEAHWSRFEPNSDVSRLNRADGTTVDIHDDTALLLQRAARCWRATDGRFDPTVHDAMVADGYDMSLDQVHARERARPQEHLHLPHVPTSPLRALPAAAGLTSLQVNRRGGRWTARVEPGVRVDPGGIGKGLAGDLVVEQLLAAGALGASVSVGGDVVAVGAPPTPSGWWVEVVDPGPRTSTARPILLGVRAGAVVTSTPLLRRWQGPDGRTTNHLRDPADGSSLADPDLRFVTVVGGVGWWSEAEATAACVEAARYPGGATAWAVDVVRHDRHRAMVVGVGPHDVVHSPAAEQHLWDTRLGVAA